MKVLEQGKPCGRFYHDLRRHWKLYVKDDYKYGKVKPNNNHKKRSRS